MFDFRDFVSQYKIPSVGHEIGQWCVYPDFKEIATIYRCIETFKFRDFQRDTCRKQNEWSGRRFSHGLRQAAGFVL